MPLPICVQFSITHYVPGRYLKNLSILTKIEKTSFSCFYKTSKILETKQVVIVGIETHICVLQTALDLINDGFSVFLVSDATGARTKYSHELGIQRMEINGTHILNTEMVFFELLRDSKHENFKELSQLIR